MAGELRVESKLVREIHDNGRAMLQLFASTRLRHHADAQNEREISPKTWAALSCF